VEGVPISGLCDELGLQALVFCPVARGAQWFLQETLYAALVVPALAYRFGRCGCLSSVPHICTKTGNTLSKVCIYLECEQSLVLASRFVSAWRDGP
jgi:hypothetical protein